MLQPANDNEPLTPREIVAKGTPDQWFRLCLETTPAAVANRFRSTGMHLGRNMRRYPERVLVAVAEAGWPIFDRHRRVGQLSAMLLAYALQAWREEQRPGEWRRHIHLVSSAACMQK